MNSFNGLVPGFIFAVSCDNGKTAVAWRENIFDAFDYLALQNINSIDSYAVVAVKKGEMVD